MKTVSEYCEFLIQSESLIDKLTPPPEHLIESLKETEVPNKPSREKKIQISERKTKIPRLEHLGNPTNRGIAMHHFANHELMAIELFAYAVLKFHTIPLKNKLILIKTITDEQKHLTMYITRMNQLGIGFGDLPLNSLFWKFTNQMNTFTKFTAIMSLSLEGANLDYSLIYKESFKQYDDLISSEIMNTVYIDEIKHVKRGLHVLRKNKPTDQSEWEYYRSQLDFPFTPRRAKGYFFFPFSRERVGFSKDFIENLKNFKDEFSNRKKESIPLGLTQWGIYSD
jgi:uncharacterized ferritin-like protein (DUF455 family)